jgi:hypothetical protein
MRRQAAEALIHKLSRYLDPGNFRWQTMVGILPFS